MQKNLLLPAVISSKKEEKYRPKNQYMPKHSEEKKFLGMKHDIHPNIDPRNNL